MIPDDEGKVLYALSFCRDRSNTLLRLNSFDIETGERKIFREQYHMFSMIRIHGAHYSGTERQDVFWH